MSKIEIEGLVKRYGPTTAVDDISLVAEEGELTSLVGPSGCGKTTTLRCVAGLERPNDGTITIDGEVVTDPANDVFVPPHKRNIGFVFQTFDVWPHLTVFENVAYPLENRHLASDEIEEKVTETLRLTDIERLRDNPATQLSGGQQARVGICRAIVYEPKVLLFDEPLTGLDRNLRKQLRYEIKRIQSELGTTSIYVTHSQPEAMTLSDKICLMNTNGTIEQTGSAHEIYHSPQTRFTFDFFGSSEAIDGVITNSEGVETDWGVIQTDTTAFGDSEDVTVGFRPENVDLSPERVAEWNENTWIGTVQDVSFLGEMYEIVVTVHGNAIRSRQKSIPDALTVGTESYVHVDPRNIYTYRETAE